MKAPNNILLEIKKYCLANKNIETCGFVIKNNQDMIIFPVENKHPNNINYFLISPKDYLSAKILGEIIYLFHSHLIDSSFSDLDLMHQKYHNMDMLLYKIPSDSFEEKSVNTI